MKNAFTQHLRHEKDARENQCFKWSIISLNPEFSFSKTGCLTRVKKRCLPYYKSIASVRDSKKEFMIFQRQLVQSKTQTAPSRIWIWVFEFISNEI